MRKPSPAHRTPKEPGALGKPSAEPPRVDQASHVLPAGCFELPTLSSANAQVGTFVSDDNAEVSDERSDKYKARAKLAGQRIKLARDEVGWSQQQLADRCGVDKGTISRIERGLQLEMSVGKFFDLCETLALDPVHTWLGERRRVRSEPPPATAISTSSNPPPPSAQRPSRPAR